MKESGPSNLSLEVNDKPVKAYLALPPSGTGPGVLVLHAWWGLNPFFTGLCDRLAAAGFVALAPDLNEGQVAETIDEAKQVTGEREADTQRTGDIIVHAIKHLRAHPAVTGDGIGEIGFSMGAWWSLVFAAYPRTAGDLKAVVLFYGSNVVEFDKARAAFLCHFAETDEWEPEEGFRQMEAGMRAAGRDATFHIYPGTSHWFFEQDRPDAYNKDAAQLAWDRTVDFLHAQLG
jgi:carboxymethylenebutenolidase